MTPFRNSVTLRGFLGKEAETHGSEPITDDAYAVLLLGTVSGVWDLGVNEWIPRTDWHRIICPGPFFCGFTRGMKPGDYLEVEGELRAMEQDRGIVIAGERFPMKHTVYAVHATHIRKLDRPAIAVGAGQDG